MSPENWEEVFPGLFVLADNLTLARYKVEQNYKVAVLWTYAEIIEGSMAVELIESKK